MQDRMADGQEKVQLCSTPMVEGSLTRTACGMTPVFAIVTYRHRWARPMVHDGAGSGTRVRGALPVVARFSLHGSEQGSNDTGTVRVRCSAGRTADTDACDRSTPDPTARSELGAGGRRARVSCRRC